MKTRGLVLVGFHFNIVNYQYLGVVSIRFFPEPHLEKYPVVPCLLINLLSQKIPSIF